MQYKYTGVNHKVATESSRSVTEKHVNKILRNFVTMEIRHFMTY